VESVALGFSPFPHQRNSVLKDCWADGLGYAGENTGACYWGNTCLCVLIGISYLQVLTRGAKVLYESCVDTVQYEEFFRGEFINLQHSHFVLHLGEN
jgi:hypothetical protein